MLNIIKDDMLLYSFGGYSRYNTVNIFYIDYKAIYIDNSVKLLFFYENPEYILTI